MQFTITLRQGILNRFDRRQLSIILILNLIINFKFQIEIAYIKFIVHTSFKKKKTHQCYDKKWIGTVFLIGANKFLTRDYYRL